MATIEHLDDTSIDLMLNVLPPHLQRALLECGDDRGDLIEIVLDLGRRAEFRYRGNTSVLCDDEITQDDIDYVVRHIGSFGEDNRAGLARTLHRISAIRNRSGKVVGLTCRVGRAVYGTIGIIRDLLESGKSVLMLGRPGVGKTTMLREAARVIADELGKRVVIVDTSNEIAGDGDIPHPGIGRARRMQVPRPAEQHAVMIEAVENHMPEVIVIDEIGTELEAVAARTIAERGVQLIGTAHGTQLENLLANPTLSDLVGGIQAVTLGDEEARRRGTQKTVLERKAPPTFDILIELHDRSTLAVYPDVAAAVDALLRDELPSPEQRTVDTDGQAHTIPPLAPSARRQLAGENRRATRDGWEARRPQERHGQRADQGNGRQGPREDRPAHEEPATDAPFPRLANEIQRIFPFGVASSQITAAIDRLGVPATVVYDLDAATVVFALKQYDRPEAPWRRQAAAQGMPVYILPANTVSQIQKRLAALFRTGAAGDQL